MGIGPSIDISAGQRKTILSLLERHLPGTEAWIYGSRAKWTSHPQSDLDLVVFATPEQVQQVGNLREAFEESDLPFRIDLFVWDEVPAQFKRQIEADHVALTEVYSDAVASHWSLVEIDKIAKVVGGGTPSTKDPKNFDGDIPWLTPKDLSTPHDRFVTQGKRNLSHAGLASSSARLVPADTVLLTTRAPIGYVAIAGTELATNQGFRNLVVGDDADSSYLYYWLKHNTSELERHASGSTFRELSGSALKRIRVLLPPLSEQLAIAQILGTLDDKIELNRRRNETLEAMARTLFRSWFVDFDPVRAKMEGRDPGLPQDIADLFPDRLVDSELGEIPEGWKVRPLPDLIDVNPQRRLPKGQVAPYLDMANMPTKGHIPDTVVDRPFGSGTRFMNGDTLVARITPCLENGKTAYVDFLDNDEIGWGSTEYIVMHPKPPLPNEFAYCLARSPSFREFAIRSMTGTSGRQRVQAKALWQFPLVHPTEKIAVAFGDLIQSVLAQASVMAREANFLVNLRNTLLPRLISGEIPLSEPTKRWK